MTTPEFQERFQICSLYCRNRNDREDLAPEIMIQVAGSIDILADAQDQGHGDRRRGR